MSRRVIARYAQLLLYSGRLKLQQNRIRDAIQRFELAAHFQPGRAVAHYWSAVAYCRDSDVRGAFEAIAKAVSAGLEDPASIETDERLLCLHGYRKFTNLMNKIKEKHG